MITNFMWFQLYTLATNWNWKLYKQVINAPTNLCVVEGKYDSQTKIFWEITLTVSDFFKMKHKSSSDIEKTYGS